MKEFEKLIEKDVRAALEELLQKEDILGEFQKMFSQKKQTEDPVVLAILELSNAMDKIPKALEMAKEVDMALFKAQMELAVKIDSVQAQVAVLREAVMEMKRAKDD
jgi:hypothetical protein